jgi:MFS family permease
MTPADRAIACWAAGRVVYSQDLAERTSVAPAPPGGPIPRLGATVALVSFAMLVVSLDQYIVIVALPDIGDGLGIDGQRLQAVISVNLIAAAGTTILGGRIADVHGRRRTLSAGLLIFALGSAMSAVAPHMLVLLTGRVAQGLGSALALPATVAIINNAVPGGRARNRALSLWSAAGAAGLAMGVLAGGILTHAFGWRSIFVSNLALAAVALAFVRRTVPADARSDARSTGDVAGATTITSGLSLLSYGLIQGPVDGWATPTIIGTLATGMAMLGVFALVERHSRWPLLPPRLRSAQRSVILALGLVFAGSFGAVLYVLSLDLQQIRRYDQLTVGVVLLIPTAAVIAGSALGGRVVSSWGPRRVLLSVLPVGVAGAIGLGYAAYVEASLIALVPGLIAVSAADGVTFTALFIAMTQGLPDEDQGIGAGLVSTATAVGGALGLALLVPILHGHDATGTPAPVGVRDALLVIALAITVMICLASRMPRPEAEPAP